MSEDDKTEEVTFEQRVFEEFRNLNLRITALETKAEERSRETRPMFEEVLKVLNARFDMIEERLDRIDGLQDVLASRDVAQDADIAKLKRRLDRIEE